MTKNPLDFWTTWTPELAYVLGFAFADGGIGKGRNSLTLAQAQTDKEILLKIQKVYPRKSHFTIVERANPLWRLRFCEPGLGGILANYGIVPNKTVYGYWPLHMPSDLNRHYIRGFFDGDGTTYLNGSKKVIGFVCHSFTFLDTLSAKLCSLGISKKLPYKDGANYRLRYGKASDISKMYDLFYKDATVFLERKKVKIEKILQYIESSQGRKGSNHGNAKLTETDIIEIRRLWATGEYTQIKLGQLFNISNTNISQIVKRLAWTHI